MRKTLLVLSVAAAAAMAVAPPASAQPRRSAPPDYVAPAVGAVTGTVVGLGQAEGWWTSDSVFQTTWEGAAATGFVAGVGTAALIHAAITPCTGFQAFFSGFLTGPEGCVNGQWVGDQPRRVYRR